MVLKTRMLTISLRSTVTLRISIHGESLSCGPVPPRLLEMRLSELLRSSLL